MGKVDVYRNRIRWMYSVRDTKARRVIGYAKYITLESPELVVSAAGRTRLLKEEVRNVHAWVRGFPTWTPASATLEPPEVEGVLISYNPYRFGYFFETETLRPVVGGSKVHCCPPGLLYLEDPIYASPGEAE